MDAFFCTCWDNHLIFILPFVMWWIKALIVLWLLNHLCILDLLPAKPLHLRSMLSKSVRFAEKTATPTAGAGQQRGPGSSPWQRLITHCTTSSFKSWTNWAMMVEFAHPPYSPFLSPTNYHFFKRLNFLQAKHFYKQQKGESAFQEFFESQSMDFFFFFWYRNKQIYFSSAKMCWL